MIDRPLDSYHPKHEDIYYSVNYGYVPDIIAPDGEEQDVYVIDINEPIKDFIGEVVSIISIQSKSKTSISFIDWKY